MKAQEGVLGGGLRLGWGRRGGADSPGLRASPRGTAWASGAHWELTAGTRRGCGCCDCGRRGCKARPLGPARTTTQAHWASTPTTHCVSSQMPDLGVRGQQEVDEGLKQEEGVKASKHDHEAPCGL